MKIPRSQKNIQTYNACICSYPPEKQALTKKHYDVVAGILVHAGKYLCMQRGEGKYAYTSFKFEFPGGKIEPGETRPQALMRELREELEKETCITEDMFLMTVEHEYSDFSITLHCYMVPVDSPALVLKEHASLVWLPKEELGGLDWAAADAAIIKRLMQ